MHIICFLAYAFLEAVELDLNTNAYLLVMFRGNLFDVSSRCLEFNFCIVLLNHAIGHQCVAKYWKID